MRGATRVPGSSGRAESPAVRVSSGLKRYFAFSKKVKLNAIDQVLSSASNFALVLMVARTSTVDDFGAFSLVYLLFAIGLGAVRAAGGDVLLTKVRRDHHDFEDSRRRLLGLAVVLGTVIGIILIGLSFLFSRTTGASMAALGVTLPALLLQDCMRYYFFAGGEPGRAAVVDGAWLLFQAASFVIIVAVVTIPPPSDFMLAWGISGALAALAGSVRWGVVPQFRQLRQWFDNDAGRTGSFLTDFAFTIGNGYLCIYLVGAILGLGAVAGLTGAQQLYLPFQALAGGLRVVILPAFTAASEKSISVLRSAVGRASLMMALAALVWGALAQAAPDRLGVEILGDTWSMAKPLILILAVANIARTSALPMIDGIRALGGGGRLVFLRLATIVLTVGPVIIGAVLGGLIGAATGMTVGMVLCTILWWIGFIHIRK